MATRTAQQEIVKATVLPALDGVNAKKARRLESLITEVDRAYALCQTLALFEGNKASFMAFLAASDPTSEGRYLRWMLNRMNRQTSERIFDIDYRNGGVNAQRQLLAFDVKKQYIPEDQRDILAYQSLREIKIVLAEHEILFNTISNPLIDSLDFDHVMTSTTVHEHDDLTICAPASIEEAAVLLCGGRWLDSRGKGFYRKLKQVGKIYVALSGFGNQIFALPRDFNEPGIVYDSQGELGMFEDALAYHSISYQESPEITELLCKTDPALPFDSKMTCVEAFLASVNQFPDILFDDDRSLDEEVRDALLAHPKLTEAARNAILECV